jgi:hypothetical protein
MHKSIVTMSVMGGVWEVSLFITFCLSPHCQFNAVVMILSQVDRKYVKDMATGGFYLLSGHMQCLENL